MTQRINPAPTLTLANGVEMPQLGLGTWPMNDAEAAVTVAADKITAEYLEQILFQEKSPTPAATVPEAAIVEPTPPHVEFIRPKESLEPAPAQQITATPEPAAPPVVSESPAPVIKAEPSAPLPTSDVVHAPKPPKHEAISEPVTPAPAPVAAQPESPKDIKAPERHHAPSVTAAPAPVHVETQQQTAPATPAPVPAAPAAVTPQVILPAPVAPAIPAASESTALRVDITEPKAPEVVAPKHKPVAPAPVAAPVAPAAAPIQTVTPASAPAAGQAPPPPAKTGQRMLVSTAFFSPLPPVPKQVQPAPPSSAADASKKTVQPPSEPGGPPRVGDKVGFIQLPVKSVPKPVEKPSPGKVPAKPADRAAETNRSKQEQKGPHQRHGAPQHGKFQPQGQQQRPAYGSQGQSPRGNFGRPPMSAPEKKFVPLSSGEVITMKPPIVVRLLADVLKRKPFQLIADLMELGVFANVNQTIEESVAQKLCAKHGFRFEVEKREKGGGIVHAPIRKTEVDLDDKPEDLRPRPPVVTIMGHGRSWQNFPARRYPKIERCCWRSGRHYATHWRLYYFIPPSRTAQGYSTDYIPGYSRPCGLQRHARPGCQCHGHCRFGCSGKRWCHAANRGSYQPCFGGQSPGDCRSEQVRSP